MKAKEAEEDHIALVHTKLHIKLIKDISKKTRGERETEAARFGDIYFNEGSSEAASLAAGSVIEVAEKVANGELDSAFAIVRPPGHHAETDKAMGFCLYNNVAIAASYLLKAEKEELGVKKILIVDWDVHHGNGIQQKFWEEPRVLYFSVHRYDSGKFYPMGDGGSSTKRGGGLGAGYNINVPWENGGYGDADYLAVWDHVLIPVAESFNPDLIIISAGFDAALGDPLGGCCVTPEGYALMLSKLMKFAGGKIVMALEGGYNLRSIANSALACLHVLLYNKPAPESTKKHPLESTWKVILELREGFKSYWPVLVENHILNSDPADEELVNAQNHETDHDRDVVGGENEEEQLSPPLVHDVRTSRQRFVDAVTKGAAEIMNGSIIPINPTEAQNLRMYVHNNILFSFITDKDMDAYEQSNRESVGTISYDEADDTILNGLMIARVDYLGHRLLAQSIMLAENGGNCFWNGEWTAKEALAEVVKRLHLEELSIRHASTSAFTLAAPPPATSKDIADRQYLWHFPRAPHDANNTGPDSLFRLVRPELIVDFCKRRNGGGLMIEVDDKLIQEAKKFFDDNVILDFTTDFRSQDLATQTLTEKLHSRGINVRDISKVAEVAEKVVFNFELQHYCSNEIVVRSAKHILKGILRNIEVRDDDHPAVSHFISGLFENGATHVDVSLPDSSEKTTPDNSWSNIRNFAMLKYQYELGEDARSHAMEMKDLIIDKICQKVGISEPIVSAILINAAGNVQPEEVQAAKALLCEAVKSYPRALTATSPPIADIASCCRHLARILHCVSNAIVQQEDHPETAQSGEAINNNSVFEVGETSHRRPKLHFTRHPNHQHQHQQDDPPSLFEIGERVIAYWCQGLYRAKVLGKYLFEDDLWRYYICYYETGEEPKKKKDTEYMPGINIQQAVVPEDNWEGFKPWVGWNQWVIERRLLKVNQENIDLMAESESKLSEKEGTEPDTWIVYPPDLEEEDDPIVEARKRLEDKLGVNIPSSLLISWIEDREISLDLGKIIDIAKPITWTVTEIISDFRQYHQRIMGPSDKDQFHDASRRVIRQFEVQLASLLYETEKHNLLHLEPSRIYGAEHLLRMLLSLDKGIFGTPFLQELFRYIEIHHNQIFNVERVDANGDGDEGGMQT